MKYLTFLFFIIVINTINAQKYQPLLEEGRYWIYNHYASNECFQLWQTSTEIRYFSGDTIIQELSYKKLVSSYVPINVLPYEITTKRSLCFMREDTMQRKVFMVNFDENVFPCADGNEVCIWDFGLNVGDTIKNCTYDIFYPIGFGDLTHNIVDSILILQCSWGYEQKHFFTVGMSPGQCNDPGLFVDTYIEGFGMQDGPIYKRFGTYLFKYCEGTLAECNIISSTKDDRETRSDKIAIFPNPASDFITFHNTSHYSNSVNGYCIRDMSNQVVRCVQEPQSETNYIIHTHDFPSGMYILQFLKDEKIVQTEKFIISH